jgi:hypothetical protein
MGAATQSRLPVYAKRRNFQPPRTSMPAWRGNGMLDGGRNDFSGEVHRRLAVPKARMAEKRTEHRGISLILRERPRR